MRKKVVIVLSGEGYVDVAAYQGSVSAYSFIQTYGLLTKAMSVCVATPGAKAPKFQCEDEVCGPTAVSFSAFSLHLNGRFRTNKHGSNTTKRL
jgi:hypothetical protein